MEASSRNITLVYFSIGAVSSANISRYVIESLAVYIGIYLFAKGFAKMGRRS